MAERWGNGWGWVGMRDPSLGRLLRGLRAEVNYIEGKRRKERGEREERKQCVRPGPASTLPTPQLADIPSPLGLRLSTCKARGAGQVGSKVSSTPRHGLGARDPHAMASETRN